MQIKTKYRSRSTALFIMSCVMLFLVFTACGGSKNDSVTPNGGDDVNIDELLGVEGVQENTTETQNPEEAEVLRLLGIEDSSANTASSETMNDSNDKREGTTVEELKSQMNELETKLAQKDRTISELQTDLAQKENRLQELQTVSNPMSTSSTTLSSGTSTYGNSYRARYKAALQTYEERRYRDAIDQFGALLAENSNHSLSDNCQYWIGESYYGLGNYTQAIAEFEKVYSYPKSNKIDAAILKLGLSYLKIGNSELARSQFEQLIANYPKSDYVDRARAYLNQ